MAFVEAVRACLGGFVDNYVKPRKAAWPTEGDGEGVGIPDGEIAKWTSTGDAKRYRQYQLARTRPYLCGSVLEVGSKTGQLGEMLLPWVKGPSGRIQRLMLSEPHPAWRDRLQRRFPNGTEVLYVDLVHRPVNLKADSVLATNVLGHIEEERTALDNIVKMLRPGGQLVIWDAAYPFDLSEFDKRVDRVRRYKREELEQRISAAGLEVEICRYINPLGAVFGWLFVRRMRYAPDPRLVRLYDRLVVPVSRGLDHLPFGLKLPFGQNIIAVARKVPQAPPKGLSIPHQRQR